MQDLANNLAAVRNEEAVTQSRHTADLKGVKQARWEKNEKESAPKEERCLES